MTSKERICKILNFRTPDRIGIHDTFLDTTIENWKAEGFPENTPIEDYFDFDFQIFDIDDILLKNSPKKQNKEKFTILSFSEPFQRLCNTFGREEILRRLAHSPEKVRADLVREADHILNSFRTIQKRDLDFAGAWAWGDLAYNKGLFFSLSCYKDLILPLHKEIFQFLNSQGLFVLFHSDGMIRDLIPYLIDIGVRAIHPLDEKSGMDVCELVKNYKDSMVFMGCMDIEQLAQSKKSFKELRKKIGMLKKNCFYIYHADYPVAPNISFENYKLAIELVKECGRY